METDSSLNNTLWLIAQFAAVKLDVSATSDAFKPMAEVLLPPFLRLLQSLCALEQEVYDRMQVLKAKRDAKGLPAHQSPEGSRELWDEYKTRYRQMVTPMATQKLLSRIIAGSFCNPPQYGYINTGCTLHFIMKSAARVTVEIDYIHGIQLKHQFVLRSTEDGWKIDSKKYGFKGETTWYIDSI